MKKISLILLILTIFNSNISQANITYGKEAYFNFILQHNLKLFFSHRPIGNCRIKNLKIDDHSIENYNKKNKKFYALVALTNYKSNQKEISSIKYYTFEDNDDLEYILNLSSGNIYLIELYGNYETEKIDLDFMIINCHCCDFYCDCNFKTFSCCCRKCCYCYKCENLNCIIL